MKFDRLLERLERNFTTQPILLYFADGRTATLRVPGDHFGRLLNRALTGAQTPEDQKELDLIRCSVDAAEPGGARMVELVRCFLQGPAKTSPDKSGSAAR